MPSLFRFVCRRTRRCVAIRAALGIGQLAPLVLAAPLHAQSLGNTPPGYLEYVSLLGTPVGSLPPLATYTVVGIAQHSAELLARYGFVQDMAYPLAPSSGGHDAHSLNSFGLTGLLPVALDGTVSLTLGLSSQHCTGCSGSQFMAAVNGDYRILSTGIHTANATRFTLAVSGEAGVGHPVTGTAWSLDVGVPLAFSLGEDTGTRLIPFITPGLAYIATSGGSSTDVNAARLRVGGGVSLFNAKSNLGASAGFQYIFVDRTQVQFGVGLSYGGR